MTERELLDKALDTLLAALAHDEAVLHTADIEELAQLRQYWVPSAEEIIDEAEEMGLLYEGLDDEEDFDDE